MKAATALICTLAFLALSQASTASDEAAPIPDSSPVTRSTAETRFTPPLPPRASDADLTTFWYGSDALYTGLYSNGRWRGTRNRVFWYRKDAEWLNEDPYQLKVTYRKLGETGPMFTVPRVTNAIMDGQVAMLLMLEMPTRGCWEVTANNKDARLSFVTWVG